MKISKPHETVYFSTKGQVVIPRRMREHMQIREGTRAVVYEERDRIILKPITPKQLQRLRGTLKGSGVLKALMEERRRERNV